MKLKHYPKWQRDCLCLSAVHERDLYRDSRRAPALPSKWQVKELKSGTIDLERLTARQDEFHQDWDQNLRRLLPAGAPVDFGIAWAK